MNGADVLFVVLDICVHVLAKPLSPSKELSNIPSRAFLESLRSPFFRLEQVAKPARMSFVVLRLRMRLRSDGRTYRFGRGPTWLSLTGRATAFKEVHRQVPSTAGRSKECRQSGRRAP